MTEIQKKLIDEEQINKQVSCTQNKTKEVQERIKKLTYHRDFVPYNLSQTQEGTLSEKLLLELLDSFSDGMLRDCSHLPMKEKIYCMFLYIHYGFSSRRLISELKIAKERGLIKKIVHFNSVLNYFGTESMTNILKKLIYITSLPLKNIEEHTLIDSSGFSTSEFMRWIDIRTQKPEIRRKWKKVHLVIGAKSQTICAIEISNGSENDSPFLVPLISKVRKSFDLKAVSADSAYLSRGNLNFIASLGAVPYIKFKSNSIRNAKGSVIWTALYDFYLNNRIKWDEGYHVRSLIESANSSIKRKYGSNLKTKKDVSQVNEILMKCLCYNLSVLINCAFEMGLNIDLLTCKEEYESMENKL